MVRAPRLRTHTRYQTFLLSPCAAAARTKCVRSTEAYHSIVAAHPELWPSEEKCSRSRGMWDRLIGKYERVKLD